MASPTKKRKVTPVVDAADRHSLDKHLSIYHEMLVTKEHAFRKELISGFKNPAAAASGSLIDRDDIDIAAYLKVRNYDVGRFHLTVNVYVLHDEWFKTLLFHLIRLPSTQRIRVQHRCANRLEIDRSGERDPIVLIYEKWMISPAYAETLGLSPQQQQQQQ